jgi:hypothetical protein
MLPLLLVSRYLNEEARFTAFRHDELMSAIKLLIIRFSKKAHFNFIWKDLKKEIIRKI